MKKSTWNKPRSRTTLQSSMAAKQESTNMVNITVWADSRDDHLILTFSLGKPDEEGVGVVDDADDPGDEDNEDVSDDHLGAHWESARHFYPF